MNSLPDQPTQPEQIKPPVIELPAAPPPENPKQILKRAKEVARQVKRFAKENPSLTIHYERKPYPCREIVQFCSACYGVTAMVTKTEEVISDQGQELGFVSVAHALSPAGRVLSGAEAACMHSESDWQGKPSYQLRSMAQTRSCSKVLCNLFAWVLRMAGFCPTPAEEMGKPGPGPRDFTTQCEKCDCSNKISDKRRLETRRKYGQALCQPCEKRRNEEKGREITAPLNDAARVGEFIDRAKAKKANGAQPIVKAQDYQDPSEVVA
jgi:hypothetical protein